MPQPLLDRDAAELTGALRVITNSKIGDDRWALACANVLQALLDADHAAAVMHRKHGRVADGSAAHLMRDFPFNTAGEHALPSAGIDAWTVRPRIGRAELGAVHALGVTVCSEEATAFSIVLVFGRVLDTDESQRARTILEMVQPVLAAISATRIPFDRAARSAGKNEATGATATRISSPLGAEQIATLRARYRLTRREVDVTRLLARGKSNAEIADRLSISAHTARHHTERVLGKIGVRSRAAIASVLSSLGI